MTPLVYLMTMPSYAYNKAVNRGDKRTRRVHDRVFVKFERSRRYRCQEKKARRGRARDPVFRDPPRRERALHHCSRLETPPTPPASHVFVSFSLVD
jgi:hypothetical protein